MSNRFDPSRRNLLQAAGLAAGVAMAGCETTGTADKPRGTAIRKGRVKQSVVFWCFNAEGDKWNLDTTCQVARSLGCKSVELVDPAHFATLKQYGLVCAVTPNGMPGMPFVKGINNRKYHGEIIARTTKAIDATAAAGFPNVIAFNGYKYRDAEDPTSGEIPLDEGARNCVTALKQLALHAEKQNVTVCLEQLNTRDDTHPMKGVPGYQGDDIDYVADIVKAVGSPRVKLLYDIFHVQVMNGDVIRRIEQYGELIAHVHTAGNPGRGELDENQELYYPAIMRALLKTGYSGYVGQEFIPTRDPYQGLYNACVQCDV